MSEDYKRYAVNVSIDSPPIGWQIEGESVKATFYLKTYESRKEEDAKHFVNNILKSSKVTIDSIVESPE
jgi:hypothetical protein